MKNTVCKLSGFILLGLLSTNALADRVGATVKGSSESLFALMESPNVELQLNRIAVGMNYVRTNAIILNKMPISSDALWVDNIDKAQDNQDALQSDLLKKDPFYSTFAISNLFLKSQITIAVTPIVSDLYAIILNLYKSGNGYKYPDLYFLPNPFDMDSFLYFKDEKGVELIDVKAINSRLYPNINAAIIELLAPESQDEVRDAKAKFDDLTNQVFTQKSEIEALKIRLEKQPTEDDENALEIKETELDSLQEKLDESKDIYALALENALLVLEQNLDEKKIPLAKNVHKALELVKLGAIKTISLFSAATLHLQKNGLNSLDNELYAIGAAQGLSSLVGNQALFLKDRYQRLLINAVYAVPNLAIGLYQANDQFFEADSLQDVTILYINLEEQLQNQIQQPKESDETDN